MENVLAVILIVALLILILCISLFIRDYRRATMAHLDHLEIIQRSMVDIANHIQTISGDREFTRLSQWREAVVQELADLNQNIKEVFKKDESNEESVPAIQNQ